MQPSDFDNNIVQCKPLTGIVIDNKDPLMLRRVRCKVQGLYEGKNNPELYPWCRSDGKNGGGRPDLGTDGDIPEINSMVEVFFPTNNLEDPRYRSAPQSIPENNNNDVSSPNYPQSYSNMDASGTFSRTNKEEKYSQTLHNSGMYTKIDKEGTVHVFIPKNLVIHVGESAVINIKDKLGIVTGSDTGITVGGNYGVDTSGTHGLKSGGAMSLQASKIDLNSGVTFGTASSCKSLTTSQVEGMSATQKEMISLQKSIKESGKAVADSLKTTAKALLGTSS